MDWQFGIDVVAKAMAALSGLGLAGLLLVRSNARGKWRLIGTEMGPLVDPKWVKLATLVAWTFAFFVVLVLARSGGSL